MGDNVACSSNRIPFDILWKIFLIRCKDSIGDKDGPHRSWIPQVLHVCRWWRVAALEYAILWRNINHRVPPAWVPFYLKHSLSASIDLYWRIDSTGDNGMTPISEILPRLRKLNVISQSGDLSNCFQQLKMAANADQLETLELDIEYDEWLFARGVKAQRIPDDLFSKKTPPLRILHIGWHLILSPSSPLLSDRLEVLHDCSDITPIPTLLQMLQKVPNLLTLKVTRMRNASTKPKSLSLSTTTTTLKTLKTFIVEIDDPTAATSDVSQLLEYLETPSLGRLQVTQHIPIFQDPSPWKAFIRQTEKKLGPLRTATFCLSRWLDIHAWHEDISKAEHCFDEDFPPSYLSWGSKAQICDDAVASVKSAIPLESITTLTLDVTADFFPSELQRMPKSPESLRKVLSDITANLLAPVGFPSVKTIRVAQEVVLLSILPRVIPPVRPLEEPYPFPLLTRLVIHADAVEDRDEHLEEPSEVQTLLVAVAKGRRDAGQRLSIVIDQCRKPPRKLMGMLEGLADVAWNGIDTE
ncbi:hypothetical protein OF83DRAFT_945549 [Amylostereum chailletii]|nr:hypothetical protein OF83DRAFT_945549 [Amylostereum chailletii]